MGKLHEDQWGGQHVICCANQNVQPLAQQNHPRALEKKSTGTSFMSSCSTGDECGTLS